MLRHAARHLHALHTAGHQACTTSSAGQALRLCSWPCATPYIDSSTASGMGSSSPPGPSGEGEHRQGDPPPSSSSPAPGGQQQWSSSLGPQLCAHPKKKLTPHRRGNRRVHYWLKRKEEVAVCSYCGSVGSRSNLFSGTTGNEKCTGQCSSPSPKLYPKLYEPPC